MNIVSRLIPSIIVFIAISTQILAEEKIAPELKQKIVNRLETTVLSLDLEQMSFPDIIKALKIPDGISTIIVSKPQNYPVFPYKLQKASLLDAISEICQKSDLDYSIGEYGLIIFPKELQSKFMQTRIYPVVEGMTFPKSINESPEEGEDGPTQAVFEKCGVSFPEGARIFSDGRISRLIVTNTPRNLEKVERLIEKACITDPQVSIEARFIQIPSKELAKIRKTVKTADRKDANKAIIDSEFSQVIASAAVLTQNGEEATLRLVTEKYLPETWGTNSIKPDLKGKDEEANTASNYRPGPDGWAAIPEFADYSDLGIRLTVTPTVDVDRSTIAFDMVPVIQIQKGWTDYLDGKQINMPVIETITTQAQFHCNDGCTTILSEQTADSKDGRFSRLLLVSARIVEPDGVPFRMLDGEKTPGKTRYDRMNCQDELSYMDFISNDLDGKELSRKMIEPVELSLENSTFQDTLEILRKKSEDMGVPFNVKTTGIINENKISLNLKNIPFLETVRYFCTVYGLFFMADSNGITISSEECLPMERMVSELVSTSSVPQIGNGAAAAQKPRQISSEVLNDYFSKMGITFPNASTITLDRFDSNQARLIMRNTKQNNRKLKYLLSALAVDTPLVEIESSLIEIKEKDLKELNGGKVLIGFPFGNLTGKILNSDKIKLLSSQKVMATSGQEAMAREAVEVYYPTSWCEPILLGDGGNYLVLPSTPDLGESRDIGNIFFVTPTVEPNNYTTTLQMNLQFSGFAGWSDYFCDIEVVSAAGTDKLREKIPMPEIECKDLLSIFKIYDGESICIGKAQCNFDPQREESELSENASVYLFFVSLRLVKPDGMPSNVLR